MERRLMDYLPYIVRDYPEFQAVTGSSQTEFEQLWLEADRLLNNQFILTADDTGLSRWEKILNLTPKGTAALDDRRFQVLTRRNERLPYTLPRFRQMLESLCGAGKSSAEIPPGTYRLRIRVAEEVQKYLPELRGLADRMVPVNLSRVYEIRMEPMEVLNKNILGFGNLKIRSGWNNWFQTPVRFNGEATFDGSIRWNQQIIARNSLTLCIRSRLQTGNKISAVIVFPVRLLERGRGVFFPYVRSAFRNDFAARPRTLVSCRIQTQEAASARLITNRKFQFDGAQIWDGSKKFNAGATTEL